MRVFFVSETKNETKRKQRLGDITICIYVFYNGVFCYFETKTKQRTKQRIPHFL